MSTLFSLFHPFPQYPLLLISPLIHLSSQYFLPFSPFSSPCIPFLFYLLLPIYPPLLSPSPNIYFPHCLLPPLYPYPTIPFPLYLLPPLSTSPTVSFPNISFPHYLLPPLYSFFHYLHSPQSPSQLSPSPTILFPTISFPYNPISNYLHPPQSHSQLSPSPLSPFPPSISFSLYLHPPLSLSPHYLLPLLSLFFFLHLFPQLSPSPSISFPHFIFFCSMSFPRYFLPSLSPSCTIPFPHQPLSLISPGPPLLSEFSILFSLSLTFPRYPLPFSLSLVRFVWLVSPVLADDSLMTAIRKGLNAALSRQGTVIWIDWNPPPLPSLPLSIPPHSIPFHLLPSSLPFCCTSFHYPLLLFSHLSSSYGRLFHLPCPLSYPSASPPPYPPSLSCKKRDWPHNINGYLNLRHSCNKTFGGKTLQCLHMLQSVSSWWVVSSILSNVHPPLPLPSFIPKTFPSQNNGFARLHGIW